MDSYTFLEVIDLLEKIKDQAFLSSRIAPDYMQNVVPMRSLEIIIKEEINILHDHAKHD